MIDCPLTPSNANRLAQLYRPTPHVRSDPGGRAKGANRKRPRPILGQTRLPNAETTTFYLKNNASAAASNVSGGWRAPLSQLDGLKFQGSRSSMRSF
jgi:hypothetical protein